MNTNERPNRAASRRTAGVVVAVAALAVVLRLPVLFAADCMNSDGCVVPLMARHFAAGEFSPYYWGQRYMASLEPLLLTPFAALGLATPFTASLLALALTLVALFQVAHLARLVGAPPWLACLFFAVPAAIPAFHQASLWGARHAAQCLGLWAISRALSGSLADRRGALVTGAILGFTFFADHLTFAVALPVAWLAWRKKTHLPLLAGAIPFALLDALLSFTSAAGRHSLPQDPRDWLRSVRLLVSSALPRLFGVEWLDPAVAIRPNPVWLLCSIAGVAALVGFGVLAARRLRAGGSETLGPRLLAFTFLLYVALHVIGALDEESVRYLVFGLGPLSVLLAWLAARAGPRVGAALVIGLLLPRIPSEVQQYLGFRGRGAACRAELAELTTALRKLEVRAVWGDYWDAYRLALASDEAVPVGLALRANRHPCWNYRARAARPVAYLAPNESHPLHAKVTAAAPAAEWRPVGKRRVTVVPETLPGLAGREPATAPPGCAER